MKKCPYVEKVKFDTRQEAQEAADRQQSNHTIRIYVCEFCGKYHLTHKKLFRTF